MPCVLLCFRRSRARWVLLVVAGCLGPCSWAPVLVLLVCARGPALRLEVCRLGCPAVVCAVTLMATWPSTNYPPSGPDRVQQRWSTSQLTPNITAMCTIAVDSCGHCAPLCSGAAVSVPVLLPVPHPSEGTQCTLFSRQTSDFYR